MTEPKPHYSGIMPPPISGGFTAKTAIIGAANLDSQIGKALGMERGKRYIIALLGEAPPIK